MVNVFLHAYNSGYFMKTVLIIIFTSFSFINSYGQTSIYKDIVVDKIGITNLKSSKKLNHFRLWWGCKIVEVWLDKDSLFGGQIICYGVEHYDVKKKYTTEIKKKYYSSTYKLNPEKAEEAYQYINSTNILNIKNSDSIAGWHSGWADSYAYQIEASINGKYWFNNYINPAGQDSIIKEAKLLDSSFRTLFDKLEVKLHWDRFIEELPIGHEYHFDGYWMVKRKVKREQ